MYFSSLIVHAYLKRLPNVTFADTTSSHCWSLCASGTTRLALALHLIRIVGGIFATGGLVSRLLDAFADWVCCVAWRKRRPMGGLDIDPGPNYEPPLLPPTRRSRAPRPLFRVLLRRSRHPPTCRVVRFLTHNWRRLLLCFSRSRTWIRIMLDWTTMRPQLPLLARYSRTKIAGKSHLVDSARWPTVVIWCFWRHSDLLQ